jgi:prepilin-type N-terminal cleavage/methylation domain-containing protein
MPVMQKGKGFTLIEVIAVLVLLGIIVAFGGLFLTQFVEGYALSTLAGETAMKGQVALDRISMELKHADSIDAITPNASITYTRDGVAKSIVVGSNICLTTNLATCACQETGNPLSCNLLMDDVQNAVLNLEQGDLDGLAGDEVKYVNIQFTVPDVGSAFEARIYPRKMVAAP